MANDYSLSVTVIGAKELEDAIKSVDGFAKQAIKDAINKTAIEVTRRAVLKAPHKQGALRGSLQVGGIKNASKPATVTGNNIQAVVGTNLEYAHYQEVGGFGKRVVRKYTEPGTGKLFLKNAKDSVKNDGTMTNNMQGALKKIVDHLATKGTSES